MPKERQPRTLVPGKIQYDTATGRPSDQGIREGGEIHARYSNILNHSMNGKTVPNTAETTQSDKNSILGVS